MAQPTYVTSGAAGVDGFATTVAVQIDLGSNSNVALLVQAFLDGGGGLGEIPPMTIGGSLSGGTTTGSGAGAINVDGAITGGTSLTMETLIAGGSYLGTSGAARAGRVTGLSLTGLQWVQLRAEYLGAPTSATKPFFVCAAYAGVSAIAAGTSVSASASSGALSQSVTTTADDFGVALLHVQAADGNTFTPSGTTVQRLRALGASQVSGYNGLIIDEPGVAGTTAMEGTFASGTTIPYAGTKWVVQGITGGGGTDATATGATLNSAWTITAGTASGTAAGTAAGATMTSAWTITAGSASGVSIGTLTLPPLKNGSGSVWASETGITVFVNDPATGALVHAFTGETSDGSGVVVVSDADITIGAEYRVTVVLSNDAEGTWKYTAT